MATSKNSSPIEPSEPEPSEPEPSPDHEGATEPSFVKRHRLGVTIGAAAVAVVLVSGLTAWGVGAAVAASYESATSATTTPVASAPPTSAAGPKASAHRTVVRGTIESITGSTWTITTLAGSTKQVTIGTTTLYGTKNVPATASDFAVGTRVLVTEKSSGHGETAVRVIMAQHGAGSKTAAPTTTS